MLLTVESGAKRVTSSESKSEVFKSPRIEKAENEIGKSSNSSKTVVGVEGDCGGAS